MAERGLIIKVLAEGRLPALGVNIDTAGRGYTLCEKSFSPPVVRTSYLTVPGASGVLDLSTSLSEGVPVFEPRTFAARLELSGGSRAQRDTQLQALMAQASGRLVQIIDPDDADHYIEGRLSVGIDYSDDAHASASLSAVCSPYRWANELTTKSYTSSTSYYRTISNKGQAPVLPVLTVPAEGVTIQDADRTQTYTLAEGEHRLPLLWLPGYQVAVKFYCTSPGGLTISWREGVL